MEILFLRVVQLVELACVEKDADIFFRLGHKGGFKKYTKPFVIDDFINLSVYAQRESEKKCCYLN